MTAVKVFAIGKDCNQLTEQIMPFPSSQIKHIHNGNGYTIYQAEDDTLWAFGDNKHKSCCVTTLKETIRRPEQISFAFPGEEETFVKLCACVSGHCTFFISSQRVFGNGNNRNYQLGIKEKESQWWRSGFRYQCEPKLIETMPTNVVDVKGTASYSISLRYSMRRVLRIYLKQLHDDALTVVEAYVGDAAPFDDEDCSLYMCGSGKFGWEAVAELKQVEIVKIECGKSHFLALDSQGVLWAFGNNRSNECGIAGKQETSKYVNRATKVTHFEERGIKIKDMRCGWHHSLVIDVDDRVWAFGKNNFGQCGYDADAREDACPVRLIAAFRDCKVRSIGCGVNHSHVETMQGEHFLFGRSQFNQCTASGGASINQLVDGEIKRVFLGVDCTHIIATATSKKLK